MARIRYGQKVSTKLTRAEKQRLSIEVWSMVDTLAKETEHLEAFLKQLGQDEVRALRKKLKTVKASIENVKITLHTSLGVNFKAFLEKKGIKTVGSLIKSPRVITPFDSFIPDEGIATSVYNVASATPEGIGYWQKILSWWIGREGHKKFQDAWVIDYFNSAYGYEDEGLGYNTNYTLGASILQRYKDDYDWVVSMKPEEAVPGL